MLTMLKKNAMFFLAITWLCIAAQAFLIAQGCLGGCREAQYAQDNTQQTCWLTTDATCAKCNPGYCQKLVGDNTTTCQSTSQNTQFDVCNWLNCVSACADAPFNAIQEVQPCKGSGNPVAYPLTVCDVTSSGSIV